MFYYMKISESNYLLFTLYFSYYNTITKIYFKKIIDNFRNNLQINIEMFLKLKFDNKDINLKF